MEKIKVAELNKDLRAKAMEAILKGEAKAINAQGSQFGVDVMGLDGEPHFVRVDLVVPKDSDEFLLDNYLEEMEMKEAEKAEKEAEKARLKAEKIARDEAKRAEKAKAKETKAEQ